MGKTVKKNKNVQHGPLPRLKKKSRKELRKEKRQAKKERKNQHYQRKFISIKNEIESDVNKKIAKESISNNNTNKPKAAILKDAKNGKGIASQTLSVEKQSLNHKSDLLKQKVLEKEMKVQRKKQLLLENRNEDKVIKKLEKQLRLNKRKSKTLPQSFTDEGLDYLLNICDTDRIKSAIEAENNLKDSGSEFEEDFAVITGKEKKKINSDKKSNKRAIDNVVSMSSNDDSDDDFGGGETSEENIDGHDEDDDSSYKVEFDESDEEEKPSLKKVKFSDKNSSVQESNTNDNSDSEESDFIGELEEGASDNSDYDDLGNENENDEDSDENTDDDNKIKKETGEYEDIYGRKRDKQGNVIAETRKYIPPHLKVQLMGSSESEEQILRLTRQIKGLLNRLAENNMHSIVSQMDQLFMQNSRNDMNNTLTKFIFEILIQSVLVPDRLIIEHTMLIAALQANIGIEVGAHFLQAVVEKFDSTYKSNIDIADKGVDNILRIIAYLYSFKVFNCTVMFDILKRLTENSEFGEKEVELLLIVLRNVGFNLRKDNPVELKNIIVKVHSVVNNSVPLSKQPRVRFMLDLLTAIKNNNMSKIPNYDPSQMEHHKKVLKNLIQKGKYISELNITLDDLLKAPERGRWWVVGSAWSGGDVEKASNSSCSNIDVTNDVSQTYLELAKKHRMSTDSRRNIFCIIMSAEDYMDAFEKLLRLGLKGPQEQTIIHVIVHCVLQEQTFNPYYAYLASQFCSADRKHLMTLQYHLWDRIRELNDLLGFQITNLALFLSHLILEKALPLSVLKVIEFTSLSKPYVRLLRRIFLTVLLHNNEETVAEVFQRISRAPKLKLFRESIRLFFHHFILRNISEDSSQMDKLKERVKIAESCMHFMPI